MTKIAIAMLALVIAGCADVAPAGVQQAVETLCVDPYGFWGGLWHGFSAWFHFFGYLLTEDIAFFATCNNGGWYTFGFALGAGVFAGGAFSMS